VKLLLPDALRQRIADEARTAFPRECCGLLEGFVESDVAHVVGLHATKNLSEDDDRFEIDPADHFAAIRAARGNGREIVGCYHSHPNGRAEPSARDAEGAWDEGFVWLIAAVSDSAISLGAFVRGQRVWHRLDSQEIAEKGGQTGLA
jgi:desampylase